MNIPSRTPFQIKMCPLKTTHFRSKNATNHTRSQFIGRVKFLSPSIEQNLPTKDVRLLIQLPTCQLTAPNSAIWITGAAWFSSIQEGGDYESKSA